MRRRLPLFPRLKKLLQVSAAALLLASCTNPAGGGSSSSTTAPTPNTDTVVAPSFYVAEGTYDLDQNIILSTPTIGAKIYYTTDGSTPTASSTLYNGAVTVNQTQTLKAIAVKTGYASSPVSSATYTIRFPAVRSFNAQNSSTNAWYVLNATRLASGTHAVIYQENGGTVTAAQAATYATEFDTNIFSKITSNFASEPDVDNNGKIIILLLDIKDSYNGSTILSYTAGYFAPLNEFSTSSYANSNQCDMLFMDTNPSVPGSPEFYETIAHEFQHMCNFNQTYIVGNKQKIEDTWINEGLSSAAEALYKGAQVQWKINYFNNDLVSGSGSIALGQNFLTWCPPVSSTVPCQDPVASYATVYLFFQWLNLNASNGTAIYKDILNSGYYNYQAVTSAASNRIGSSLAIWQTLFRSWLAANVLNQSTGLYGYHGAISSITPPKLTSWPSAGGGYAAVKSYYTSGIPLYCGEAIYLDTTAWNAAPTGTMDYVGITNGSTTMDNNSVGGYTGNVVVAFNYGTTAGNGAYTSLLPSAVASLPISTSIFYTQQAGKTMPGYPIDMAPVLPSNGSVQTSVYGSETPRFLKTYLKLR